MMMSAMPMATMVGCYAIAGLVLPRSPKLELANLKIEACRTISNIDTTSRARVHVATEVVWVGGVREQATDVTVLRCVVVGTDGGGGLR
jgi:hypothetical protein